MHRSLSSAAFTLTDRAGRRSASKVSANWPPFIARGLESTGGCGPWENQQTRRDGPMGRAALAFRPVALPVDTVPLPLTNAALAAVDPGQARIGRPLFQDRIPSGNRDIACATCHLSSEGLSSGIGEGGAAPVPDRTPADGADRTATHGPRKSSTPMNLGAHRVETPFRDARLTVSDIYGTGFDGPAAD